jgi:parallel beta-helix repeat protein
LSGAFLLLISVTLLSAIGFLESRSCYTLWASSNLPVHNINTGLDYPTIQMAIDDNQTSDGNTLVIDKGLYVEHVFVTKSLNIIGKNRDTTILSSGGGFRGFIVSAEKVNITGFTIQDATWAIHLNKSSADNIFDNIISASETGIYFDNAENCSTFDNLILDNWGDGIYLGRAEKNLIQGNLISDSECGVSFTLSTQNIIRENTIMNCTYATSLGLSDNNSFYHNNFTNSSYASQDLNSINRWDQGYPFGGNYWSDYNDTDHLNGPDQNMMGSDGIGDKPYTIDSDNQDSYPFMGQVNTYDVGTWNNTSYHVEIVSNSTVFDFSFNASEGPFARFDVRDENGTGFCRAIIPRAILWAQDGWKVTINSEQTDHNVTVDENYSYVYFTYKNGLDNIEIQGTNVILEFPAPTIILLALAFIAIVFMLVQDKPKNLVSV